jgi:MEMO1 family protein
MMMSKPATRPAAVAGMFYPASASELRRQVGELLAGANVLEGESVPKALIAPHAGYVYSGPIAASAYARLKSLAGRIRRVVLLGPVHRVPVRGLALAGAERFATPLGDIEIDADAISVLQDLPQVVQSPGAHAQEHSLEVQLPFLQQVLGHFKLVPLAVGDASAREVADVIDRLWGGPETLIVVSSDLSHYLPYALARDLDRQTADSMLALRPTLEHEQACGATPINGLLTVAQRRGLRAELLDLRNSGDTAGDRSRVVGYAAVGFFEPGAVSARDDRLEREERDSRGRVLLAHARAAIAGALRLPAVAVPESEFLREPGASFVTLRKQGELRGCIGSLQAHRPLGVDVRENAVAAAFDDPRFAPLTCVEFTEVEVEISLLSVATPLQIASEAELHAHLRAGIDGVTLELGTRRGTFLPQVWDALPDPREFVRELKRKAGLPRDFWSAELRVSRYTVEKFCEAEAV